MEVQTFILIAHLLGVCFGLGGTLILDFRLLGLIKGTAINQNDVVFAQVLSRFVQVGLVLLWASGIAFFSVAPDGPASLMASPKLQAKLVIVIALTLNGILIGGLAVPLIERNIGRPLFDGLSEAQRTILMASAVVSSVSWLTPFVLGSTRAFNMPVSAEQILEVYLAITGVTVIVVQIGTRLFYQPVATVQHPNAAVATLHEAFPDKRLAPALKA
jgi:hypothetical protein